MYDTLIMLKPGSSFTADDLHRLLLDVTQSGAVSVEREGDRFRVFAGTGQLDIGRNDAAYVAEESTDIAEKFGIPSRGCHSRFEMTGDDPDMELFNDYLLINERLQATGKFVIFDTYECKLLFEEPT